MQFSDRIRTENSVYDSYKPYGSTSRCDPFAVPLMRYNVPVVYGPKTAVCYDFPNGSYHWLLCVSINCDCGELQQPYSSPLNFLRFLFGGAYPAIPSCATFFALTAFRRHLWSIRELKHARFLDAHGNRKRPVRLPGPYCLPNFYTSNL